MSRATRVLLCSALAAHLSSCTGILGSGSYVPPTEVEFTWDAVNPETVHIAADGNVQWINLSSESRAFVTFPATIRASFTCDDLRPYFLETKVGYRSLPLTAYESERVQLPCPLKPGSYTYEIWLVGAGEGEIPMDDPERVLRATIVVD